MTNRNHSLIKQVIYVSTPVGFSDKILDSILIQSQVNNKKNEITGALICRSDLYLQYLEGPAHKIDFVYSKIKLDNRHSDVILLEDGRSKRRLFSNWAMKDDPVKDWMWSKDEVADGAIRQLSEGDAMKIFIQHSREVDQFLS